VTIGFSRRLLLRIAGAFAWALPLPGRPASSATVTLRLAALPAWLDTLIPPDETPGAGALGIADRIHGKALDVPAYQRLLTLGCAWLDQEARQRRAADFASLQPEERAAVASLAERSPAGSLPRVFFARTWDDARDFYYADPIVWPSLGYAGPPQPAGFPGHDRPPRG